MISILLALAAVPVSAFLFWRYIWFFRNPARVAPKGENIVSPADGSVVYVKTIEPGEEVIVIKQGVAASVNDIVKEDLKRRKVLIGIFMSPFNVHYNRTPLSGEVEFIKHHLAANGNGNAHMGPMHFRILSKRPPFSEGSVHIVGNERKVTKVNAVFKGSPLSYYIIQIAARSVDGIDVFAREGERVEKGELFGIIRIGSQVDLVIPWHEAMRIRVQPGDKVRAGESLLIE